MKFNELNWNWRSEGGIRCVHFISFPRVEAEIEKKLNGNEAERTGPFTLQLNSITQFTALMWIEVMLSGSEGRVSGVNSIQWNTPIQSHLIEWCDFMNFINNIITVFTVSTETSNKLGEVWGNRENNEGM